MALNSRPSLDPRWVSHNRNVAISFMVCEVNFIRQELSSRSYDPETNTWGGGETTLWSGNARVQPMNNAANRSVSLNDTVVQQVQVQIELTPDMADIRPGDYMLVSSSPLNAQLESFVYIVRSVLNSSNPWQRTILCDVDMEADPNA